MAPEHFAETGKEVRRQLGLSQKELSHELCVSFSTINRWKNSKTVPFKLARRQFEAFCERMKKQLSERDICTKYITPALEKAGWDVTPPIREEFPLTKGRIIVGGTLHTRAKQKSADYVLLYKLMACLLPDSQGTA